MSSQAVKVVYFYSDEDRFLVGQMRNNLSVLQTHRLVELWCTRDTKPGQPINQQIINSVKDAKIVLYFFSPDFVNSPDYLSLSNIEMEAEGESVKDWILKKHLEGQLLVIPILLSNLAGFSLFPESGLSVLPKGKPLGSYERAERMNACFEIAETIKTHIEKIRSGAAQPIQTPPRSSKIPPFPVSLLPQLCARLEQTDELKQVFDRYKSASMRDETKRPLVCVVHGDVEECPEGYKARLEKRDIYELLQMDYEHPIKIYNLEFPNERFDIERPQAFFDKTLKQSFYESPDYDSADSLCNFLNQFRTVIINYDVFSENWNKRVMESFLDFWNTLPVQNTRATIIVNLFFSYDENSDSDKESNLGARVFFDELKQKRFAGYPNIDIAVTPELDAIERIEVVKWLNNPKVFRDFCSHHTPVFCDETIVRQQINDLYSEPKTPRRFVREIEVEIDGQAERKKITLIRMRTLSDKLGNLLVKKRCRL